MGHHDARRLDIAFESEKLTYSDAPVDLYNSGVNQILSVAASRGHRLYHFSMADLYVHENVEYARASVLGLPRGWEGDPLDAIGDLRRVEERPIALRGLDLVFVRGDDIRHERTRNVDILRSVESRCRVVERIDATLATCDKYELVKRCPDVPQPVTYAASELVDALDAISRLPTETGYFVLKDRYGYGCGAQVHRLRFDDPGLTSRVHEYVRSYGDVLLQEYCPEVRDGDIVFTFFDDDLIGTMKRTAAATQWKTNASLGAEEVRYEPTEEQTRVARAVRRAFSDCRIASIDMLPSGRVIEINAFPGASGLLKTHGVALGQIVMDRMERELAAVAA